MKYLFLFLLNFWFVYAFAQKPQNGRYIFKLAFAEWQNKSMGATCTVVVKDDSIKVLHNGSKGLSGKKGDVLDSGKLIKHVSGKWIIAHNKKDRNAKEIGGCSDGPTIIDLKRRIFYTC